MSLLLCSTQRIASSGSGGNLLHCGISAVLKLARLFTASMSPSTSCGHSPRQDHHPAPPAPDVTLSGGTRFGGFALDQILPPLAVEARRKPLDYRSSRSPDPSPPAATSWGTSWRHHQASALGGLALALGIHLRAEMQYEEGHLHRKVRRWQSRGLMGKTSSVAAPVHVTAAVFAGSGRCPARRGVGSTAGAARAR